MRYHYVCICVRKQGDVVEPEETTVARKHISKHITIYTQQRNSLALFFYPVCVASNET
jgi:hypothetical protein